jgi:LmbE family N-acetylglucosaminyl deacetylase
MSIQTHRAPALFVSLAFLLASALPLPAQITAANDPANLAGERVSPQDLADTLPLNHGAPALEQLLRKLRTRASFMLIVAHPDDEDNGMLTYLSRGKGARVATLTLNRGEGGQNLMSADFDDALGLIRTQELLAADRYMAVDQFFGTEVDFGFSKTKEEAFAKWTHERVLYDAVRAVRLYRPLVIASVFIGEPSDGHGQHQVSGQIAQEVFNAAGDPKVFPDQIAAGLQPWQPLKVYARSPFARIDAQGMYDSATGQYVPARFHNYVTGKVTDTVPKANVTIPEGDADPLLGGISYAELGREGRSLHRSQMGGGAGGPGGRGGGGRFDVSYHRYGSHVLLPDGKPQPDGDDSGLESGFFDGIDTGIEGIATLAPHLPVSFRQGLKDLSGSISRVSSVFDATHSPESKDTGLGAELLTSSLTEALRYDDALIAGIEAASLPPLERSNLLHELRIKRVQLNNALVLALGLALEAHLEPASDGNAPPKNIVSTDDSVHFSVKIYNRGTQPAVLTGSSRLGAPDPLMRRMPTTGRQVRSVLAPGTSTGYGSSFGNELPVTRPYFSRPDIEQPFYDISNPNLRDAPATPAPLVAWATFDDQGVQLRVESVVQAGGNADPIQAAVAVPPISVTLPQNAQILPSGKENFNITVTASPPSPKIASLALDAPWSELDPNSTPVRRPGTRSFLFAVPPTHRETVILHGSATLQDGSSYSEGYRSVGYPGLTYTNYYTPATTRVVPVDVTTAPDLNIAYLPGTGDNVPAALDDLGIHPHLLALADLTAEKLKQYDAVILGVRAYAAHPELAGPGSRALLDYAANGGVVLLQYMTARFGDAEAPFPISVPGDPAHNVIDEAQPVTLLAPDSPLLSWPNRIAPADFDHWIEERGHGFAATWSPQYTPLLEVHDPGQPPQQGGLLVARTGKGLYIYCAFALYRQLPEGVPGAYRLLANLISASKNPGL